MNISVKNCNGCPFYQFEKYDEEDICLHPVHSYIVKIRDFDINEGIYPKCPKTKVVVEFN